MRTVDEEKGWFERKHEDGDKGKKLTGGVMVVVAAIGFFILANLLDGKTIFLGEPYVVRLGNVEVRPGRTTVKSLTDAGYDLSDASIRKLMGDGKENSYVYPELYDLHAKVDKNTVYTSITLVKDGQCAALISVLNEKSTEIPLAECKVGSILICPDYYESEYVTLEGISFGQLSVQNLTQALGKPKKVSESGDSCRWERGVFRLVLECREDGTTESLRAEYTKF